MILNIYFISNGGVGHAFTFNAPPPKDQTDDILTSGFFIAIRSFGRNIYQELQYIQFVRSRVCFLPSQDQYVLCVHATNEFSPEDLLVFLEDIRDDINTNFWTEIHDPNFYCEATSLKKKIFPFMRQALTERGWMR